MNFLTIYLASVLLIQKTLYKVERLNHLSWKGILIFMQPKNKDWYLLIYKIGAVCQYLGRMFKNKLPPPFKTCSEGRKNRLRWGLSLTRNKWKKRKPKLWNLCDYFHLSVLWFPVPLPQNFSLPCHLCSYYCDFVVCVYCLYLSLLSSYAKVVSFYRSLFQCIFKLSWETS